MPRLDLPIGQVEVLSSTCQYLSSLLVKLRFCLVQANI